jgi:hypothetical protein
MTNAELKQMVEDLQKNIVEMQQQFPVLAQSNDNVMSLLSKVQGEVDELRTENRRLRLELESYTSKQSSAGVTRYE